MQLEEAGNKAIYYKDLKVGQTFKWIRDRDFVSLLIKTNITNNNSLEKNLCALRLVGEYSGHQANVRDDDEVIRVDEHKIVEI